MEKSADRIEKSIRLRAPRSRVWQSIADSQAFGEWFGIRIVGPWKVGQKMQARFEEPFTQETIDGALAGAGLPSVPVASELPEVFCIVEAIEPESRFAFRWIPFGIEAGIDPATEPMTLVEFSLVDDGEGTLLSVTESGFDKVPLDRRQRAFLMDSMGWAAQVENLAAHLGERAGKDGN